MRLIIRNEPSQEADDDERGVCSGQNRNSRCSRRRIGVTARRGYRRSNQTRAREQSDQAPGDRCSRERRLYNYGSEAVSRTEPVVKGELHTPSVSNDAVRSFATLKIDDQKRLWGRCL